MQKSFFICSENCYFIKILVRIYDIIVQKENLAMPLPKENKEIKRGVEPDIVVVCDKSKLDN